MPDELEERLAAAARAAREHDQIHAAQDNVDRSAPQVRALPARLSDQAGTVTGRLDAMAAERQQLPGP